MMIRSVGGFFMKRSYVFFAVFILAFSLFSCGYENTVSVQNGSDVAVSDAESKAQEIILISLDGAKKIALGDAHFTEQDVIFVKAELFDGPRKIYDIEFTADGKEWDYEINAKNGQIMNFDNKIDVE